MNPLQFAGKADAYLEWAQHTRFAFVAIGSALEAGLLVQTARGWIETQEQALRHDRTLDPNAFDDARRLELATPIAKPDKINIQGDGLEKPIDTVLGVIDDGCPFARPAFIKQQRIQLLWQQGAWKASGAQWNTQQLKKICDGAKKDDALAYERLGLKNLRQRATHGAHVLDVFAGPVPPRARVSPSRMKCEGLDADGSAHLPPPWTPTQDPASRAPIVFVQLPQEAIEDPTGRWLGRYVLDGVDFIVQAAAQLLTPKTPKTPQPQVVINISWGPQTGPHDGSSLLEMALDQRVAAAAQKNLDLHLVLPSGNSHEARAHAQWAANAGCEALHWHVAPDADHPQFLEIWWPAGTAIGDARLSVTAPDGSTSHNGHNGQHGVFADAPGWSLVVVPHPGVHGVRQMALLALAPTRCEAGRPHAPHGRWTVAVEKDRKQDGAELVHAYVARNSANMGSRRRGRDGYLFDPAYEATRHGRWPRCEPDNSLVRREGTLSGLATGAATTVTGGYVLAKKKDSGELAASYTSSGPGAGTGGRHPDWSQPSDESPFLRGIRAGGVRDGTSIRLIGTSAAAPQLARKLANREALVPMGQNIARGRPTSPPAPAPAPAPAPDPRLGTPVPMKKEEPV